MATNDGLSILVAIKFVTQLAKPFEEWKAFELGLIDAEGNKIKEPKTPEEKKCFASWFNLIRNIKRMLVKIPGGKSTLASLVVAFSLLKEGIERESGETISEEDLNDVLETFKLPLYHSPKTESNHLMGFSNNDKNRYAITNELISEIIDNRPVVKCYERCDFVSVYEPQENRRFFVCKSDLVKVTN